MDTGYILVLDKFKNQRPGFWRASRGPTPNMPDLLVPSSHNDEVRDISMKGHDPKFVQRGSLQHAPTGKLEQGDILYIK